MSEKNIIFAISKEKIIKKQLKIKRVMDAKENLISNIVFKLNTYGDFKLEDVDIYDDEEQNGECHKAEMVCFDENKIPCVELENDYVIPLEELSYNELLSIYEEIE